MAHLSSALAHEINPLPAIINYVNRLRRVVAAGKQAPTGQTLERIAEQPDRAKQIIESLRDLLKKGERDRPPEDLKPTVKETKAPIAGATRALNIMIAVDTDAATATIDRIQLHRDVA